MPFDLDLRSDAQGADAPWPDLEMLPKHPPIADPWTGVGGDEPTPPWNDPPPLPPPAAEPPGFPPARGRTGRRVAVAVLAVAVIVLGLVAGAAARGSWIDTTASPPSTTAPSTPSTRAPSSPPSTTPRGGSGGQTPPSSTPRQSTPPSTAPGSGSSTGTDWDNVADKVNPGVVDINTRVAGGVGAGTGIVLSDSGIILTNNHVIDGAQQIVVTSTTTGERFDADVIGTDPAHDVAVLQVSDPSGLTPVTVGDSDAVQVGDEVAAIGNAGGQGGTPDVAPGKVVALHQSITASSADGSDAQRLTDMIQTDADVVSGDSGGPLVDADGKVIGVNAAAGEAGGSAGGRRQRGAAGTHAGFAIPINTAVAIAEQLQANGSGPEQQASKRALLGVSTSTASGGGAAVQAVTPNSPAAGAGLEEGDVIVAVDGAEITSADDLVSILSKRSAGDDVKVSWVDPNGRERSAVVTLAAR